MRFSILTSSLATELKLVRKLGASLVSFYVTEGQVKMLARANDIILVRKDIAIEGEAEGAGSVTVWVDTLDRMTRELPEAKLTFSYDLATNLVTVVDGNGLTGTLISQPVEHNFYKFSHYLETHALAGEAQVVEDLFQHMLPFRSQDHLRPTLTGLYFYRDNNGKQAVAATDTRRLRKMFHALTANNPHPLVVDGLAAELFSLFYRQVLWGEVTPTLVSIAETYIKTQTFEVYFPSLSKGKFPDVERVIPNLDDTLLRFKFDQRQLLATIKTLLPLAKLDANRLTLTRPAGETGRCAVSVKTSYGTATRIIGTEAIGDASDGPASFNALFLKQLLYDHAGNVSLYQAAPGRPGLFMTDGNIVDVVMPMSNY